MQLYADVVLPLYSLIFLLQTVQHPPRLAEE